MWPFLGPLKERQARRLFKKLRRIHSLQNSFLCKFENRLDFLACRLGFAPSIYWSRIFISMGWIWVSNQVVSGSWKPATLPFLSSKSQGIISSMYNSNSIKCNKNYINMFLEIKSSSWGKVYQKLINQQMELPKFFLEKTKYQRVLTSPLHVVKHHEMVHISPFLKKRLAFWFMNKFRKTSVPWYVKWNEDRTVALINEYNNLHHGSENAGRLDKKYFTATYLMAQR